MNLSNNGHYGGCTTATNQINVVGGQNSVTLTPTGSAGCYRLVPE